MSISSQHESAVARERAPHDEFLGIRFANLNREQTVRLILDDCDGPFAYVVTPNTHHLVTLYEKPDILLPVYHDAWLSVCDSQILRGLAVLDGLSLPLVTGSDLVAALLSDQNTDAPRSGRKKILVVGPEIGAEQILQARYPRSNIRVMPAPAQLAQRADLRSQVARACTEQPWDILLLCVGFPTQELIANLIAKSGRKSGVALCAGAAIDFLTGRQSRAPRWMQKFGLEWAYRLGQQPGRLWRRYLVECPKIVRIYLKMRRNRAVSGR